MPDNGITRQDFLDLKQDVHEICDSFVTSRDSFAAFRDSFAAFEERVNERIRDAQIATVERLTERIRDAQTELLRGFEKFQTAGVIRMRKIEADQSNLSTSTSLRLDNLEERVLEIEKKLLLNPPQP